jgi:hypothetical protein
MINQFPAAIIVIIIATVIISNRKWQLSNSYIIDLFSEELCTEEDSSFGPPEEVDENDGLEPDVDVKVAAARIDTVVGMSLNVLAIIVSK